MPNYPKCDKCGSIGPHVVCREAFGVGIRLCRDKCDKEYRAKMDELNAEMAFVKQMNSDLNGDTISSAVNRDKRAELKSRLTNFKKALGE